MINPKIGPRIFALLIVLLCAFLFTFFSRDPHTIKAFFLDPLMQPYAFSGMIESAAILLCTALGAAVAFRAGAFNLGEEGQMAIGCLSGALCIQLALRWGLSPLPAIVLACFVAALAGSLLALLSSLIQAWSGAEIMLTSFLCSQAVLIFVDWAIAGPFRDALSNLIAMPQIPPEYMFLKLDPSQSLSVAALVALAVCILVTWWISASRNGIELSLYGANPNFAVAAGISTRISFLAMAASGALCGLAGALLVLGPAGRAIRGMTGGIGWDGLSVALVASSNPVACLPVSLFFSWIDSGTRQASIIADFSSDAGSIMKALILLFITARVIKMPQAFGRKE